MKITSGHTGFILLALIIWQTDLDAQDVDTVLRMAELEIVNHSLVGEDTDSIDLHSLEGLTTLSDILRSQSNVYFRDFGPGSSSTISIFGSKPNEVALVWNGIKISNPMLGVNDYSLISNSDFTSLRIAQVGSSTIFGAGSGSGAILLDQRIAQSNNPFRISAGWSTLNRFSGGMEYTDSEGKWEHKTSMHTLTGKNNFQYKSLDGTKENLPHARSNYWTANHHSVFTKSIEQYWIVSLWTRKHEREIPPALSESISEATQSDEFIRSVIQYHLHKPLHRLNIKAYYGYQNQQYRNPRIKLDARHRFQNAQLRMDNQWQPLPDVYVKYGMNNNFYSARSDNYTRTHQQYRISAYAQPHYEFHHLPLEVTALIQPEWLDGQSIGWTNEIKLRYLHKTVGQWMIFANQNIVWPTLNDLYWSPGGNPDLVAENNRMVGLSWKNIWSENLQSKATMYYRQAENWIQWTPTDLGYWRPFNAQEGRSYGIHMESQYDLGLNLKTKGGYQFVRTYVLDHSGQRLQAIYSPSHMWHLGAQYFKGEQWTLHGNGEYTSARFVTRDHSDALDPYFLLHAGMIYTSKNPSWIIGLQVRNILGTEYQGIKNRPMPGRQIEINTKIKF